MREKRGADNQQNPDTNEMHQRHKGEYDDVVNGMSHIPNIEIHPPFCTWNL